MTVELEVNDLDQYEFGPLYTRTGKLRWTVHAFGPPSFKITLCGLANDYYRPTTKLGPGEKYCKKCLRAIRRIKSDAYDKEEDLA